MITLETKRKQKRKATKSTSAIKVVTKEPENITLPTVAATNGVLPEVRKRYHLGPEVEVRWICQSENTTYLVCFPGDRKAVLRICRQGYHSKDEIATEIAWMARLKQTTDLIIPQALPGIDDELIQSVTHPTTGAGYLCVMFTFVPGATPDNLSVQEFLEQFERLGEITAQLHQDVLAWPEANTMPRFRWDFDDLVGSRPRLGSWEDSPHLDENDRAVIKEAILVASKRLKCYGREPQRYGLIHSDLRCANLLIAGRQTALIDFDDCGFGYFMYDFGSAVTFIEDHPDMRSLIYRWVQGYRRYRTLSDADIAEIKTFILLRRIAIHGWVISHWEANDVRNGLGIGHDRVTVKLAQQYLQAVTEDALIW
jgi:Ser/Thr protein kinase RdoA (MazF antagonist)